MLAGLKTQLLKAQTWIEVREAVVFLLNGCDVFIAYAEVQHEPWADPIVVLEKERVRLLAHIAPGLSDEDLSQCRSARCARIAAKEVLERGVAVRVSKLHLATAAIEGAGIGQSAQADLAAELEGMISMQDGNVFNELVDVVGAIEFGETGAATDAGAESL